MAVWHSQPRRRPVGLRLPAEARSLLPVLAQRLRIEGLIETLITLLDSLEDTDGDACPVEDMPPPAWITGPGDADDAEPALVRAATLHGLPL